MKYSTYLAPGVMALILAATTGTAFSAQVELVKPEHLIVDKSLPQTQLAANEYVAREYATFWNTEKSPWPVTPWRLISLIKRPLKVVSRDLMVQFWPPGRFVQLYLICAATLNK